jgi:hypothetical protein
MPDPLVPPLDPADVLALDEAVARSTGASGYGLTDAGFVPKPFARLLTEKLALARSLLGADVDLNPGSVVRKLLELSALEDARTWAALASVYDNQFVATATGEALSRLGEELGLARPFLAATGQIELTYRPQPNVASLTIPRGARLSTAGHHHVATLAAVTLETARPTRVVPVIAFYPGPEHNLDPAVTDAAGGRPMKIDRWNPDDYRLEWDGDNPGLTKLAALAAIAPEQVVSINHAQALTGGEQCWPDARYRKLLLRAPRSLWTVEAIRVAAQLVAGVRQVQVIDGLGGVDVELPLFGNFNFGEALFASGRDLAKPYHFDVLVAPSASSFWEGPAGLQLAVASAIEDLRPIGVGVNVQLADQVFVGIEATVVTESLPLPRSASAQVNSSAANELKQRLLRRVADHVDSLGFGEPVRYAEVMWALMNEPGVTDVVDLHLLRFPPLNPQAATTSPGGRSYQRMEVGVNVAVGATQIVDALNDDTKLTIR